MTPFLFLFGSVHSLLRSENELFERLDHLPYHTFINIGLESCDTPTLAQIGKPLDNTEVLEAFDKMVEINAIYENIEVTGNFVIGKRTLRRPLSIFKRVAPKCSKLLQTQKEPYTFHL